MNNLSRFGVQELSVKEVKETQGGGLPGKIIGFLVAMIYNCGDSVDANPYSPIRKM